MVEYFQYREATQEVPSRPALGGDTGYRPGHIKDYKIERIGKSNLTRCRVHGKIVGNPHKEEPVKSEAKMRER